MSLGKPCGSLDKAAVKFHYQYHATEIENQVPPIQNQWYTILEGEDVMVYFIVIFQENDEAVAKDIETRITVDGVTITGSASQNDNTWYYKRRVPGLNDSGTEAVGSGTASLPADTLDADLALPLYALSFKVEMRITSALGTNQELRGRVVYYTREST